MSGFRSCTPCKSLLHFEKQSKTWETRQHIQTKVEKLELKVKSSGKVRTEEMRRREPNKSVEGHGNPACC